jgi:DNA-binding protein Fis
MKKLLGIIALIGISALLSGQKSIDALFDKYAGKDGFTTVTINGNLLKLAATLDDDKEDKSMPKEVTQIRILAQDDDGMKVENFYDLVIKDLDLTKYEEFMQVKESNQDVRMLVRTEDNKFTEFLLIVGGKDNALIQIKGAMTFEEAKKFADDAKKDHGANIIEKQQ